MEELKTVHIKATIEVRIPRMMRTEDIHLGIAGSKILNRFEVVEKAEILTWWVDEVCACNSTYVNCPQCKKIQLVCRDAVILDGKPLCIHCTADFQHGDVPVPRTPEQKLAQVAEIKS